LRKCATGILPVGGGKRARAERIVDEDSGMAPRQLRAKVEVTWLAAYPILTGETPVAPGGGGCLGSTDPRSDCGWAVEPRDASRQGAKDAETNA
jgi:hypothetical protein